jgi:hypothetical protein
MVLLMNFSFELLKKFLVDRFIIFKFNSSWFEITKEIIIIKYNIING